MWSWLLACVGGRDADSAADTVHQREALELVVIADSHCAGSADALVRLERAVAHVNAHADEVDLVLIVGDIAWGDGLETVLDALEPLAVPWVPLVGDNEGHAGSGEAFIERFTPAWEDRADELDAWRMAPTPVLDAEGRTAWLTTLAFTFGGVHFYGLDLASRSEDALTGELGELHPVEGGTWPWWLEQLEHDAPEAEGSVVTFTHIPMHLGAFDLEQMATLAEGLAPFGDVFGVNLAGHVHVDAEIEVEGLWESWVTDATFDDEVRVRHVFATPAARGWEWTTEVVEVP